MTTLRETIARALWQQECGDIEKWPPPPEFMHYWLEGADAALAAIEAAGWQCVPKELTEEMLQRARDAFDKGSGLYGILTDALAAAPKPGTKA